MNQTFEEFQAINEEQLNNVLRGKVEKLFDEAAPMSKEEKVDFVLDMIIHLPLSIIMHYNSWLNGTPTTNDPPAPPAGGPGGPPPEGGPGGPPPQGGPGGPPPQGGPGGPPPMK